MKWLVKRKAILCGRNCRGCPHGHYYYGFAKVDGRTKSKYLGKEPPPGMYESAGKWYVGYSDKELPPLPEMPTLFVPSPPEPPARPEPPPMGEVGWYTYCDAKILLGISAVGEGDREKVRKRVYNLSQSPTATAQDKEAYGIAFSTLCRAFNWKLPRN